MCISTGKGENKLINIFRPHRLLGIRSPIDSMLHPTDKYNLPKTPTPEPVIERQAYKDPATRQQLASEDANRRRMIAGVATSTLGVPGPASTTRGVISVGGG